MSGFQKSGVYPLDRHAISIPGKEPPKKNPLTLTLDIAKQGGINFLSLYSPVVKSSQPQVEFTAKEHKDHGKLSEFLMLPPSISQVTKPKTRVLTSAENLKALEEKERQKEEEIKLKEQRCKESGSECV